MSKAEPAEKKAGAVVKVDEPATTKRGWASWAIGWVLLPGSVIGALWGAGVLVGVHFHDSWFTRAVVWTVDLFV